MINIFAIPNFPTLSSYIVDEVSLLNAKQKQNLINKLHFYEKNSSIQIVVVILDSLNGYDIAQYGYELGRYWKIGQKDKNNGLLLIISMKEHKVRIEVGYGLEGAVPDILALDIIQTKIVPRFKQKDYYKGINEACDALIKATKGEYKPSYDLKQTQQDEKYIPFLFFIIVFFQILSRKLTKNKNIQKTITNITLSSIGAIFSWLISHNILIVLLVFILIFSLLYYKYKAKQKKDIQNISSSVINVESNNSSFENSTTSKNGFKGGGGSFGGGGASSSW